MVNIKYKLRYLPLFYEDLEQKVLYISEKLQNEKAANDLIKAWMEMKVGLTFACMNLKKLAKMKARKGLLEEKVSLSNVILDVI